MLVCAPTFVSCGAADDSKPKVSSLERSIRRAPISPAPANLIVDDDYFLPKVLKVHVGTEVVFSNDGHRLHDVIPTRGGGFRIDTDELRPGTSKTVIISEPGTYPYFCSIHGTATSGMRGTIAVVR